jgi:GNAT superfamily N-acetyltransferase
VIEIRPLAVAEVEAVDTKLPLHRLEQPGGTYLIAWLDGEPVAHARVDWRSDPPEAHDVFVAIGCRRQGVASALMAACEKLARDRGHERLALEVDATNVNVRSLYEKLGYRPTGAERRVQGTIVLRGEPLEVDNTLVTLEKALD